MSVASLAIEKERGKRDDTVVDKFSGNEIDQSRSVNKNVLIYLANLLPLRILILRVFQIQFFDRSYLYH